MRHTPPESLVTLLGQLGLASPGDFRAVAGRARRLVRGLPLFESVWVDALAQAGILTAFQAAEINARRAEKLRVGPYLLDCPLGSLQYAVAYAAHAAESSRLGKTRKTVRLLVVDIAAVGVSQESSQLFPRLEKLVADSLPLAAAHGILPVIAAGIDAARAWVVCPDVSCRTAAEWMVHNGRFQPAAVLEIARQTASALAELQRRGLSHGDIRAQTLLLSDEGRVLLAHPGLRAVFFERESHAAAGLPPEAYDGLSPERSARGESPSPAADAFACGCLWWHLLTARAALPGACGLAKMRAAESLDVPDVRSLAPDAPQVLADAIAACVARDPTARPQSFAELAETLGTDTPAGRRLLQRTFGRPSRLRLRTASCRFRLRTAAALLCLAAAAAWFFYIGGPLKKGATAGLSSSVEQKFPKTRADKQPVAPARSGKQPVSPARDKLPENTAGQASSGTQNSQNRLFQRAAKGVEPLLLDAVVPDAASLHFRRGQTVMPRAAGRVQLLVPAGGLAVGEVDVRFERIDFICKPAASETESKPAQDEGPLVDLRESGAAFHGCTFSSPSGKAAAIRWTYPNNRSESEPALPSGWISFENCVFQGVSTAVDCRAAAAIYLRAANVLHLGGGPLLRLERMPRPDEPLSLALDRVTLRDCGPLLQCRVDAPNEKSARVSIETTASVLVPAEGAGLLVFLGDSTPQAFLERIEWTGQGSLVGIKTPIAQLIVPKDDAKTLDESAISIAGLVRGKVEFAGPADSGVAANRVTQWQAPVRSADPPGVDVSLLPGKK